jgi:sugar lactone lactonase YvrE
MHTDLGSGHGITVDKYGNIWYGEFDGDDRLKVFAPDGTPLDTLGLITVPIPGAGRDTTFTLNDCRGLDTDIDGNILFARSGLLLKIDVDTREPITYYPFPGSPLNPAVDDQGFIYVGYVVGVTPIELINPTSFLKEQDIVLELPSKHTGFARGMDVSLDGLTFYPGDLAGDPHMVPIYTSTDYENYFFTDSIYTDNTGTVIMQQQTVTVSTKPGEGTIWYSIDNAYGTGGNDQLDNNLTMMDFANDQYGLLYMPPPVGPTGRTGPRGAAWSPTGDTLYVASWGEGAIYKYVHEDVLSINEEGEGGLPISYELNQNYPNPFNPITNIEFTVPKAGKVKLTVFNVLGQKVATLVDQNVPRGTFKVQFDASKYASGMYFYRLQAADVRIEKKMMLIK